MNSSNNKTFQTLHLKEHLRDELNVYCMSMTKSPTNRLFFILMVWIIQQFCVSSLFAQGKLFIIGGGKRPPELIQRMLNEAGRVNYVVILPFASEEQDSSVFYASKQFEHIQVPIMHFTLHKGEMVSTERLDSIAKARLIYIPGGNQVKFMEIISSTGIASSIEKSYQQGGLIGGTSAGAAIMSQQMITGTELKYKSTNEETESDGFKTIEAQNVEISQGLGLLKGAIIDQHFIKRKRMNRLMTVAIENKGKPCIGIDESTALLIKGVWAEVVGQSQVVYLKSVGKTSIKNWKLGCNSFKLMLYTPGDKFKIE